MKKPICPGLSLVLALLSATTLAGAQVGTASPAPTPQPTVTTQSATSTVAVDPASGAGGAPVVAAPTNEAPPAHATSTTTGAENAPAGDQSDDGVDKGKKKKKKKKGPKADKAGEKAGDPAGGTAADDSDEIDGEDDGDGDKKEKAKESKKLPWEAKSRVRVGGLLHSQFAINDAPDSANYDFRLANARIFLDWQQGSLLDAQAEVELSRDGDRNATSWAPMRDAYVRVSFDPAIRARLGQFKRPFGKVALTNLRELKLIRRGISDVWVNEELGYGERDVGFMLDGKIGKGVELHYALGVFNGNGRNRRDNDPNGAKDYVGRLEGRLGKHLSIGVNSANKRFDPNADRDWAAPKSAWMTGADILVEYEGLYGLIEGQYGSNYRSARQYHTGSLLALVAYKIPVTEWWQIAVEPLVKGEILKVETEVQAQHVLNGTAGANLHVGDIFRLMVQGEWIEPKGMLPSNLAEARAEKRLIVQAGMYTR